eukprot:m.143645 g.143645  ORF g.143645 m.143645 type:complete len:55 (+) comp9666_c0_seq2:958-1122(+)
MTVAGPQDSYMQLQQAARRAAGGPAYADTQCFSNGTDMQVAGPSTDSYSIVIGP